MTKIAFKPEGKGWPNYLVNSSGQLAIQIGRKLDFYDIPSV